MDNKTIIGKLQILVVSIARQIFDFQRSDFFDSTTLEDAENQRAKFDCTFTFGFFVIMVGLGRLELPTSPLSPPAAARLVGCGLFLEASAPSASLRPELHGGPG